MRNIFNTSVVTLFVLMTLASCKKEEKLNANLNIIDKGIIDKTALDVWLDKNYLTPYNIETKYRFDRFELKNGLNITPPEESQVIPLMEMVKSVWIEPFEKVGGADFIKRISPKQFVLAGSAAYNQDGSITLGTAEGGRKIVLYVVNTFDKTNLASVKQAIQVIQHEYTHILNQTVDYQTDYQMISRGGYMGNWTLGTLTQARALGFITAYARAAPEEDYAEMSSNMLMMGRVGYNAAISTAPADAQVKLKKKEQYVVDYFKSAFNIDFYALQTEVQNSLYKISAPVLAKMLGAGIGYTKLYSNPVKDAAKQSVEFLGLWKAATNNMTGYGLGLQDVTMTFKSATAMTLRYSFTQGSDVLFADADYTMAINASGVATLQLAEVQPTTPNYGNMDILNDALSPVNDYFKNNKFKIDWINQLIPGNIGGLGSLGAFYKQTDPKSYFYGTMGQ